MGQHQLNSAIKMANEIAANIGPSDNHEEAIARTYEHIKKFWPASMKQQALEFARNDSELLSDTARQALLRLG